MSYVLGCFGKGCIYNAIVEAGDEVETCTLGPYITTCYVSTTTVDSRYLEVVGTL